jgi:hypothetical protein
MKLLHEEYKQSGESMLPVLLFFLLFSLTSTRQLVVIDQKNSSMVMNELQAIPTFQRLQNNIISSVIGYIYVHWQQ